MPQNIQNPFLAISEQLEALASAIDKINLQKTVSKPAALPQMLTSEEVISMLRVCRSTLWNWERNKTLVPSRVGRRKLYKLEDIQRLLERRI